jgi:hypothetical protein
MSTEATPAPATEPIERLLSLRTRLLRASAQADLLRTAYPTCEVELDEIQRHLRAALNVVSDIVYLVAPLGANDTEEDIEAEQKRIQAEKNRMYKADALRGLEGDNTG